MVSNIFEKQPATQERYLQSLDVDVGVEGAPSIGSDSIGDEGRKKAIEVEEEENSPGSD